LLTVIVTPGATTAARSYRHCLSVEPRSNTRPISDGGTVWSLGGGNQCKSEIPVQEVLSMKAETAAKIKYGVWGLICGAVIAMIIGFAWGGWTTSSTTQTMTKEAVLASQAAICVAQFMKQPNHEKKLKELGEVSSWQRAEVIEKGGWDKMPGQEKAGYAVARACADGLDLLFKK
jgi:hypothetical protein